MLYNGIGLQTPRGSGTSGFVERNKSSGKDSKIQDGSGGGLYKQRQLEKERETIHSRSRSKVLDTGIRDHNMKRAIEVQCMELRDILEDEEVNDEVIEKRVDELRKLLLEKRNLREKSPERIKDVKQEDVVSEKNPRGENKVKKEEEEASDNFKYESRYKDRLVRDI